MDEPNATWRFTLRPSGGGTLLAQSVRLGVGASGLHLAIAAHPDKEERIVDARMRQFRAGLRANLAAIREQAHT